MKGKFGGIGRFLRGGFAFPQEKIHLVGKCPKYETVAKVNSLTILLARLS